MRPFPSIAIASGKGGTGKTTIAVNLAWILSQSGRTVQYLDCDAEEPNGAVFLKPLFEQRKSVLADVPLVDGQRCTGCGQCGRLCQYGAIISIGSRALTFETLCRSCGGCMLICPNAAISAKKLEIGLIEHGKAGQIDVVQGLLKIGSIRTTTIIDRIRKQKRADAITIIDAPPGTSCPVIAAVRRSDFALLVTEPTPFGLHDLKLAVGMVRQLGLPFAAVINRADAGDERVEQYCAGEGIEILLRLPDSRRIARAYSDGYILAERLPEYRRPFEQLAERIGL